MVTIEAIIQPHKLEEVRKALLGIGIQGMTVFEVKEFGPHNGHTAVYRGAEYQIDFQPKLQLTFVIPETMAEEAVGTIQKTAGAGKIGGGKSFVSRINSVLQIRTGEADLGVH
jgi:nitrogen regulatory protein PII